MPALTTVRDVEIARVGTWHTSTGVWTCTREQIASAVEAQSDPAFRTPVLKIGHTDPRFNDPDVDGEPAIGQLANLRAAEDGDVLVCDLVNVPAWLPEVMAGAYPSRSIEANVGVIANGSGKSYPMVVTGLSLLGVAVPAIQSLADIASLFRVSDAVEDYVAARRIAATYQPPGAPMPTTRTEDAPPPPEPTVVHGSASITELQTAAREWVEKNPMFGDWAYVCEIRTDTLIVDDTDRYEAPGLWQVAWSEAGGAFTFGDPVRVRMVYEPVPDTPEAVAASVMALRPIMRAVRSARGRGTEAAVTSDPQEQPMAIDADALRSKLGLAEGATDEEITAALDARLAAPPETSTEKPAETTAQQSTTSTEDVEALIAARIDAAMVAPLATIADLSQQIAARNAADAAETKRKVIEAALLDGKIPVSARATWEEQYDAAPQVVTKILAEMARGTSMTVQASGVTGGEPGDGDDVESLLRTAWPAEYPKGG